MTRDQIQVGHTYQGPGTKPRLVTSITDSGRYVRYEFQNADGTTCKWTAPMRDFCRAVKEDVTDKGESQCPPLT